MRHHRGRSTIRMEPPTASASPSRATCLAIAIVLTIAGRAVPAWDYLFSIAAEWCGGELTETQFSLCHDLSLLAIAALLCLSAPRQSGLCIGAIRQHWRGVLLLTAALFALWHVPNFGRGMSIGFVCFQLAYTGLGALVIGMARVWTGSVWYGLITHCANNAIAAFTS